MQVSPRFSVMKHRETNDEIVGYSVAMMDRALIAFLSIVSIIVHHAWTVEPRPTLH